MCFSVNHNFIIVDFLTIFSLKYFFKNATIYSSRNKRSYVPAGNYLFKVNNKSTRTRCEICSKLTIKTPERRQAYIRYIFCNKHFKVFLEVQMSKEKPTPMLAIKNLLFRYRGLSSFLHIVIFFSVQYLFSVSVTTSH